MRTFYLLFILISITACHTDSNKSINQNTEIVYNKPPNLEGKWRYIRNEIIIPNEINEQPTNVYAEWTYFYNPNRADIIIEGDSMYRTEYPLELFDRGKFDIGSCYIKTYENIGISRYVLKDDTLILYRYDEGNFVKEYFKKTDYSDSTMSILKKDTINYALLAGTWFLQRSYNYGNDGSEYWLDYPHTIPDTIHLPREHILKTMHNGRQVTYLTDGVKRSYTYSYVGNWLNLKPGDWFKGDDVVLEFELKTW